MLRAFTNRPPRHENQVERKRAYVVLAAGTAAAGGIWVRRLRRAGEVRRSVTVALRRDEVEERWRAEAEPPLASAAVRFEHAPGDRGTEIHVVADAPAADVERALRRFKQRLEAGEVARA